MKSVNIKFRTTNEERKEFKKLAQEKGFKTMTNYIKALIEKDSGKTLFTKQQSDAHKQSE